MNKTRKFKGIKRLLIIAFAVIGLCAFIDLLGHLLSMRLIDDIHNMKSVTSCRDSYVDIETGYQTFISEDDFVVLQLTDLHIGGGLFSARKDRKAVEAVFELISRTKPDLVVLTGDQTYSISFLTGTLNNKRSARIVAELMEQIDVNWTLVFGNHDYEDFTFYDQKEISDFYLQSRWDNCLYQEGSDNVDGYGNYVINIENPSHIITHSMYFLDSQAYTTDSFLGIDKKYDNIHPNQVDWYKNEIERLDEINHLRGGGEIQSSVYFHIPLYEYLEAWLLYQESIENELYEESAADYQVSYEFGMAGEEDPIVFHGVGDDRMFEQILESGHSTAVFVGHDHLNTFSLLYKGVRLTYGMSIDYLSYHNIHNKTEQRGGTLITIASDGSINVRQIILEE